MCSDHPSEVQTVEPESWLRSRQCQSIRPPVCLGMRAQFETIAVTVFLATCAEFDTSYIYVGW